jgi:hypothetical protein
MLAVVVVVMLLVVGVVAHISGVGSVVLLRGVGVVGVPVLAVVVVMRRSASSASLAC